jgi:ankyrin repeat protein
MTADRKQNYAMHESLEYGCLENFDFLWNLPGAPRPPLATLIHTAVWPAATACLDRILQIVHQAHGGTIPALDTFQLEGRTPLITALSTPVTSIDMVRLLLSRGSNPGYSSTDGQSPALVVAAACDKWDAVGCMVRESLYQPLPLTRLLCALLFIVGVTPQTLTQFIRITGAPTNEDDSLTGRTVLEHAISLARADLVTVLLQHGAQVNRVSATQPWRTPIHYALLYYAQDKLKYHDTVRVLQSWGADFRSTDASGHAASTYALNLGLPP